MASVNVQEVPGLFIADVDGGWLLNLYVMALHRGPTVKKQLKAEGRPLLLALGEIECVRLLPDEVELFYFMASSLYPLVDAKLRLEERIITVGRGEATEQCPEADWLSEKLAKIVEIRNAERREKAFRQWRALRRG